MNTRPTLYTCECGRIFGAELSGDIGVDPDFLPKFKCDDCSKKQKEESVDVHMA